MKAQFYKHNTLSLWGPWACSDNKVHWLTEGSPFNLMVLNIKFKILKLQNEAMSLVKIFFIRDSKTKHSQENISCKMLVKNKIKNKKSEKSNNKTF